MTTTKFLTKGAAIGVVTALMLATTAHAGPESPSSFEAVQYEAQKMLYDWNFHEPNDGLRALVYVRNHLAALEEFGDLENSEIIRRARK